MIFDESCDAISSDEMNTSDEELPLPWIRRTKTTNVLWRSIIAGIIPFALRGAWPNQGKKVWTHALIG